MTDLTLNQSGVLEALLASIGLGIVVTDTTGTILLWNIAATKILGPVGAEKTQLDDWPRRFRIYLSDGITLCPATESPLLRALKGEEADNVEVLIAAPEAGSLGRWCNINLRPLISASGEIEGAVLVIQDVTEKKMLADEAARSNEAFQQFASVAAHDLQEPLRSVAGFVDLLSQHLGDHLDEKSVHYMSRITNAVKRMRNLINDLLTYSRIQTKPQVLTKVNCNQILESCIENLNASIIESGATVSFDPLPTILADSSQLSQLFQNLLGNALKFAAKDKAPVIKISVQKRVLDWHFSIKDNGLGIDMQHAERIFAPFQRLNPGNIYAGTGIGLAICKRIVHRHGGQIWIESEPGNGSTFHLTILMYVSQEDSI